VASGISGGKGTPAVVASGLAVTAGAGDLRACALSAAVSAAGCFVAFFMFFFAIVFPLGFPYPNIGERDDANQHTEVKNGVAILALLMNSVV